MIVFVLALSLLHLATPTNTTCLTGYYYNANVSQCIACASGCSVCCDEYICSECQSGKTHLIFRVCTVDLHGSVPTVPLQLQLLRLKLYVPVMQRQHLHGERGVRGVSGWLQHVLERQRVHPVQCWLLCLLLDHLPELPHRMCNVHLRKFLQLLDLQRRLLPEQLCLQRLLLALRHLHLLLRVQLMLVGVLLHGQQLPLVSL